MAESKNLLQLLHLSNDVESRIHSTISLYTKHNRCLLETNKYSKHTATIKRMDNAQSDKLQLSNKPGIG